MTKEVGTMRAAVLPADGRTRDADVLPAMGSNRRDGASRFAFALLPEDR